jgi:glycosyltransferase involved in cell wall biosynthesis
MMRKLLQINTTVGWNSTGRIAEGIGEAAVASGWESYIAYGRRMPAQVPVDASSQLIKVGSKVDQAIHLAATRLADKHGLMSATATKQLIRQIDKIAPDIVQLHNIHGYYLNYPLLFDYLAKIKVPVVWTMHDFWPVTGHCAFPATSGCCKWTDGCHDCPQLGSYPKSLSDRSSQNYALKRDIFNSIDNLSIVAVSQGVREQLSKSFLSSKQIVVIYNGVDINPVLSPKSSKRPLVLGVASVWEQRKGLDDIVALRPLLPKHYRIIVAGLSSRQIRQLPDGVEGLPRISSYDELGRLYSSASVLVSPSRAENLCTVNLEAQSYGTPVASYADGTMGETISENTGLLVPTGDIPALADAVQQIVNNSTNRFSSDLCRRFVAEKFNRKTNFMAYINLYERLLHAETK